MSGTRILVIALLSVGAAFGLAALNLRVFPAFWAGRILDSAQVDDAQVFAPEPEASGADAAVPGETAPVDPAADSDAAAVDVDSAPTQPEAPQPVLTAQELTALLAPIFYESGSADLSGSVVPRLEELARYLISKPRRRIMITGYSTPSGGMRYNRFMASQRARVVRDRLQDLGVLRRQMVTEGIVYSEQEAVQLRRAGQNPRRAELRWYED